MILLQPSPTKPEAFSCVLYRLRPPACTPAAVTECYSMRVRLPHGTAHRGGQMMASEIFAGNCALKVTLGRINIQGCAMGHRTSRDDSHLDSRSHDECNSHEGRTGRKTELGGTPFSAPVGILHPNFCSLTGIGKWTGPWL